MTIFAHVQEVRETLLVWEYGFLDGNFEGKQREALLNQIKRSSMAAWHHIYMDGEYDFSDERVNTITKFPLSKILGLKLTEKQGG